MILTGGTSQLPGIRQLAANVLNMPVRVARPENLVGLVDQLQSPAYSTSVGLLKWLELMTQPSYAVTHPRKPKTSGFKPSVLNWDKLKVLVERLLP